MRQDRSGQTDRRYQAGFSLIEMSVCLIILSVLISGALFAYQTYRKDLNVTKETILRERITSALAFYVQKNNRFPCPADSSLTPYDADFGKEPTGCSSGTAAPSSVLHGMVPIYALNLPYHLAGDLYDRKITYAVTESLTKTNGISDHAAIKVTKNNGDSIQAPFILVYHGQDGKGAIALSSSSAGIACSGGGADVENCDGDADFRDFQYAQQTSPNLAAHFDDRVVYSLATKESSIWSMAPTATGMAIANKNNANVGIGITNPSDKLHVIGDIKVNSANSDVNVSATGNVSAGEIHTDQRLEAGTDIQGRKIRADVFTYD